MVYGRKSYYRRYKRSSKLSKANIYSNRGAKAQSKQIAALSRKVNVLSKVNKPELRTMWKTFTHEFTNSTFSSNFWGTSMSPYIGTYGGNDNADGDVNLSGNFNKSKGATIRLNLEYRVSSQDTAYDNSAGIRVVVFQEKIAQPFGDTATNPTVQQVFNVTNNVTSDDTNIVAPLVTGITQQYKILCSKIYTLNKYRPNKIVTLKFKGKDMLNFSRSVGQAGVSPQSKGKIWIVFLTGGLHYDTDYNALLRVSGGISIAFTDN